MSQFCVKYPSESGLSHVKSPTYTRAERPVSSLIIIAERRSGYSIPVTPFTISIFSMSCVFMSFVLSFLS